MTDILSHETFKINKFQHMTEFFKNQFHSHLNILDASWHELICDSQVQLCHLKLVSMTEFVVFGHPAPRVSGSPQYQLETPPDMVRVESVGKSQAGERELSQY